MINVSSKVNNATYALIEKIIKSQGGTVSSVVRGLIEEGAKRQDASRAIAMNNRRVESVSQQIKEIQTSLDALTPNRGMLEEILHILRPVSPPVKELHSDAGEKIVPTFQEYKSSLVGK